MPWLYDCVLSYLPTANTFIQEVTYPALPRRLLFQLSRGDLMFLNFTCSMPTAPSRWNVTDRKDLALSK